MTYFDFTVPFRDERDTGVPCSEQANLRALTDLYLTTDGTAVLTSGSEIPSGRGSDRLKIFYHLFSCYRYF